MSLKVRNPFLFNHEGDSTDTKEARFNLATAEAVVEECKKKLALTKREARVISEVRKRLGDDVNRVANAIRGDRNHD